MLTLRRRFFPLASSSSLHTKHIHTQALRPISCSPSIRSLAHSISIIVICVALTPTLVRSVAGARSLSFCSIPMMSLTAGRFVMCHVPPSPLLFYYSLLAPLPILLPTLSLHRPCFRRKLDVLDFSVSINSPSHSFATKGKSTFDRCGHYRLLVRSTYK